MVRIAVVKRDKCHPKECGNYLCRKVCPVNRTGKNCIVLGEDKKAKIIEDLCVDCGICIKRCPFDAITIINLPEILKEEPVFRYGANKFELFRLIIPQKRKVVGLLGANAIGKTTALEILANLKKPNLGDYEKDFTNDEIIEHFKGTELQNFFKELFESKIKISYKSQRVDQIPKVFKGDVEMLLNKVTRKLDNPVIDELGIRELFKRNLTDLSGGELQKVAITVAILKEADLYLFDEPTSFLDIKERMKVAKAIRNLAEEKYVIVIEHDLIVLDYLSDLVHVIYGQPAVYGIISHPMSSRVGVNAYLDGYLRDENVRFRDQAIKFEISPAEALKRETYVEWPELKKKFPNFSLEIENSGIFKKEVVGVIGANASGKTTFMKLLAGELKPDEGKLEKTIKISYKPQYITASKTNVLATLTKINKQALSQENKLSILRPLDIEGLLNKNLDELSGGELQRIAIAACLLREADLYLLDEPSTYLDVEQRLNASKAIQKVVKNKEAAALVIDHDLLFIANIADRTLVFQGEPGKTGKATKIRTVKDGLNMFLKDLDVTLRKDPETNRPRVNKHGSLKDREQREKGEFYL